MQGVRFYIISAIFLAADQITKLYFSRNSFFIFNYSRNTGAAFGILKGQQAILIVVAVAFIVLVLVKLKKESELASAMLLAGTTGNLVDRLVLGYVRDFIDLKVWPVFNLADILNTIGILMLILVFAGCRWSTLLDFRKQKDL